MGRLLITGSGMVAGGLLAAAQSRMHEVSVLPRADCDVTNPGALTDAVQAFGPDTIFHTAAATRVNFCEQNPDIAFRVNVRGTENAVLAARAANAELIVFSTDYVFDGSKTGGWLESDTPNPLNVYGETKLKAESAALEYERGYVVRTSGVFGKRADNLPERNFFSAVVGQVTSSDEKVPVVSDQFTAVTCAPSLAEMLFSLLESGMPRITHLVCGGENSWAGWAKAATGILQIPASRIEPVPSKTQNTGTLRPIHSVLKSCSRLVTRLTEQFPALDGICRYLECDRDMDGQSDPGGN